MFMLRLNLKTAPRTYEWVGYTKFLKIGHFLNTKYAHRVSTYILITANLMLLKENLDCCQIRVYWLF